PSGPYRPGRRKDTGLALNDRIGAVARQYPPEPAGLVQRKNDDRQAVVARQRNRRSIHYAEVLLQHLVVSDPVVALGIGMFLGVLVVDAIHLGALEDRLAAHLVGPERRGGVGGEIGVAGAGGEDADPLLFQVPN